MHHSEHRKRSDAEYSKYRYNEAPLLHYKSENEVGVGCSYVLERAIARAQSEQSAVLAYLEHVADLGEVHGEISGARARPMGAEQSNTEQNNNENA